MKRKNIVVISILTIGIILMGAFLGIAKKEIIDYRNRGIDVTSDESVRIPIEELAKEFVYLGFSKEHVNCEEIICNKEVAEKYNSTFNSLVKYHLDSEIKKLDVDVNKIIEEPDGEYKVNFYVDFKVKFNSDSDTISGGSDNYTAYVVEREGKFYIDKILNDVNLNQFKNEKNKLSKFFTSEEELYNQAMNFEIESRKLYDEYKKSEES